MSDATKSYFIMIWPASGEPNIERVESLIKRIGELDKISVYSAENILDWS